MRHRLAAEPRSVHSFALRVAGCARGDDIRWMDDVFTRADLTRMGFSRNHIAAAVGCCLHVVRRGSYVLLPGCSDTAHSPHALPLPPGGDRPGTPDGPKGSTTSKGLKGPKGPASPARPTSPTRPASPKGLVAHARFLRALAASYGPSLPDDAVLSHISAALVWDLPLTRPVVSTAEASRPGRSRRYASLHVRHRRVSGDRVVTHGLRVTTLARTLLDVAADYHLEISVPMIDHAMRHRMTTQSELEARLQARGTRPGVARMRTAIALADGTRESPAESICAVRFHEHGLTGFAAQVVVRDRAGRVIARADFLDGDAHAIVEVNGALKYVGRDGDSTFERERRRDYALRNAGFRVFQLTWKDLFSPEPFLAIKRFITSQRST